MHYTLVSGVSDPAIKIILGTFLLQKRNLFPLLSLLWMSFQVWAPHPSKFTVISWDDLSWQRQILYDFLEKFWRICVNSCCFLENSLQSVSFGFCIVISKTNFGCFMLLWNREQTQGSKKAPRRVNAILIQPAEPKQTKQPQTLVKPSTYEVERSSKLFPSPDISFMEGSEKISLLE